MTLIFCIDDGGGMLFGGKRQSRDRVLNQYLLSRIGDAPLWVTPYSASLFPAGRSMENCGGEGYALIEDGPYDLTQAEEVILCRWNRRYPGDVFFDEPTLKAYFKKIATEELEGSSHKKITIETYRRK